MKKLSASRLNAFLGCAHAAALWLDDVAPPEQADEALELIRTKGFEHEAVVLARLESEHGPAVRIPGEGPLEARLEQTAAAITEGAPLIYQAALANERWVGFPDFLVRDDAGRGAYQPEDAKLARKAKAEHVLQLGVYSALLHEAIGATPSAGVIHVGGGEPERFDLRRTEVATTLLMGKFEAFATSGERQTRARRSAACAQCAYRPRCEGEWRAADSPVFVAGIRADQIIKLEAAGVATLGQLAAWDLAQPVVGIGEETLAKLVRQAQLQREGAARGAPFAELQPVEPGRGYCLLPSPAPGDLFFDMEGDPLYPEGLEYLFGLWGPLSAAGADTFLPIWAHDRPAEKAAFETLIRTFIAHLARYPAARIYHYAPYEPVALKRLAMRHATMEAELDQLLREQRFIDLYQVARQAIRASTEGYSLKDLEKIYWGQRSGEVTNAGDSIVQYERWRETGEQSILDDIEHYNREDCVSTARMRDWLEGLRPAGAAYGLRTAEEPLDEDAQQKAQEKAELETQRTALAAAVRAAPGLSAEAKDVVAELLWFHQRAQKPQWWALFDRQTWTDADLVDDLEAIGAAWLDPDNPPQTDKRSTVATYRFAPQETKLKEGDSCKIALTLDYAGAIVDLDEDACRVVLRRATKHGPFPERCSLIPANLIRQNPLVEGVRAFAERVATGQAEDDAAVVGMLERRPPRLLGCAPDQPIIGAGEDLLTGAVDAIARLDRSHLVVQGPPGAGKTYTISHAILALLQAGKRVAVSSNSHKAINNLLEAIEARAAEANFRFAGAKKASKGDAETLFDGRCIGSVLSSDDIKPAHQLVGGTAFHFAGSGELRGYDYVFVDEAGQVALGNLVAMAGCAQNLVLVGDQMQLPQPVQGVHPGASGLSCLDYLMQDRPTVPPEEGILLNVSWRMHPEVCAYISDAFYEGRLTAHATAAERRLVLAAGAHPCLKPAGVSVVAIDHEGCTQASPEEAAAIADIMQSLLGQAFRDESGVVKPMRLRDILVVAPFNAQVNLLRRTLPAGARVGTVDKFQGQEAAVAIISMTSSSPETAPRGTEFLFSRNRLNVAMSRAQCLAILVRSRRLLDLSPATLAELERLDAFARAEVCAQAPAACAGLQ